MTKKIGLIAVTYHNYGSVLQSFALQKKVQCKGFDTEIINYTESKVAKINRCRDFEYLYSRLKMLWKVFKMKFVLRKQMACLSDRHRAYDQFIEKYFNFSKHICRLNQIPDLCENYKLVLLGSDQVWHPMNVYMDFFTMNYVPNHIKKAAYAPSFGVKTIPNKYKSFYRSYLSRINYLSCRENTGVNLIKELVNRDALHVCDPTMLLDSSEWREELRQTPFINGKYIFCYLLGNNPNQRNWVRQLKEKTGYKIVALTHIDEYVKSDNKYADETPYNVGPLDFLNLIDNASYVITDSFHASVFSILFHKQFFVFDRFEQTRGSSTVTRITSLLSVLGLNNRFTNSDQPINVDDVIDNWAIVEKKLIGFRKQSLDYLDLILQ